MFTLRLDAGGAEAKLTKIGKQVPFALSIALNRTAEDSNHELRKRLNAAFTIRAPRFVNYVAPRFLGAKERATKERLRVVFQTEPAGRLRGGTIFNPFEKGEPKVSTSALFPVAVPTKALRPTPPTVVPRTWFPANLGLVPKRGPKGEYFALGRGSIGKKKTPFKETRRGVVQIQGKRRTFVLQPEDHRGVTGREWGVYRRTGPKRGDIEMIWHYRRRVSRPAVLGFVETHTRTFTALFDRNWQNALRHALATAR